MMMLSKNRLRFCLFWLCIIALWVGLNRNPRDGTASMSSEASLQTADRPSPYQEGRSAIEKKDYAAASRLFRAALSKDPQNPDVLNMLAFSERKQDRLAEAFGYYEKALHFRSRFPEAREYLAEAHLQAAMNEWRTLRGYGSEGKEEAGEIEKAFKQTARQFGPQ